jgi:DnaK suppressor protein
MDLPERNRFQTLVLSRCKELETLKTSADPGTAAVELDQSMVGRLSRMDALQMQQMNLASERRRNTELFALRATLNRIDLGEFGVCLECGNEINPKRLEIDLTATMCIVCASVQEQN